MASDDAVNEVARSGTGVVTSEPLYVSSVSYSTWSIISPVGSNIRAGSSVLSTKAVSTTREDEVAEADDPPPPLLPPLLPPQAVRPAANAITHPDASH